MAAPRRRARSRTRPSGGWPIALVVIVTLLMGAGLGALGYHFLRLHTRVPLKAAPTAPARMLMKAPPRPKLPAPKGPAPGLPAATQFDFYTILPQIRHRHRLAPPPAKKQQSRPQGVFPHAHRLSAPKNTTRPVFGHRQGKLYIMQAASFPDRKDARLLVARLALHGLHAYIERVRIAGRGTFYRVRIGPLRARRVAKARSTLANMRLQPIVLKVSPAQ